MLTSGKKRSEERREVKYEEKYTYYMTKETYFMTKEPYTRREVKHDEK